MRLELTRKTDFALRALVALDRSGRMKAGELAERIGTTTGYTAQVMSPLVREGWVVSDRGPTGGYELAVALDDVSLLGLIEAIEGPTVSGRCVLRGGPCPASENCALHDAWSTARDALLEHLGATTLTDAGASVR
jgi:Rrf2 family protein